MSASSSQCLSKKKKGEIQLLRGVFIDGDLSVLDNKGLLGRRVKAMTLITWLPEVLDLWATKDPNRRIDLN